MRGHGADARFWRRRRPKKLDPALAASRAAIEVLASERRIMEATHLYRLDDPGRDDEMAVWERDAVAPWLDGIRRRPELQARELSVIFRWFSGHVDNGFAFVTAMAVTPKERPVIEDTDQW
jgi:hypothetical protein